MLDFPSTPNIGDTHTALNGSTYEWDGNRWLNSCQDTTNNWLVANNGTNFLIPPIALGDSSISIGNDAKSNYEDSITIGESSLADREDNIAIGHNAIAQLDTRIIIGYSSTGEEAKGTIGSSILFRTEEGSLRINTDGSLETSGDGGTSWDMVGDPAFNWMSANNEANFTIAPSAPHLNAIAIGNSASCGNDDSVAIGTSASCPDNQSIAIGMSSNTTWQRSVAIGYGAVSYHVAIGSQANAPTTGAIAIGTDSVVGNTSYGAISIGMNSNTGKANAIAIGRDALVEAVDTHSIILNANPVGLRVSDTGTVETTIDNGTIWNPVISGIGEAPEDGTPYVRQDAGWISESGGASYNWLIANKGNDFSIPPIAEANYSIALGHEAKCETTTPIGGIAIGYRAESIGSRSISLGEYAQSYDESGLALGRSAEANYRGIAIGKDAVAGQIKPTINTNHKNNIAIGTASIAFGSKSIVIGASASSTTFALDETAVLIGANAYSQYDDTINIITDKNGTSNWPATEGSIVISTELGGGIRVNNDGTLETSPDGGTNWSAVGGGGDSNNWLIANNGSDFTNAPTADTDSIAIGEAANASHEPQTIAIGYQTEVEYTGGIAIGNNAHTNNGVAIGPDCDNNGTGGVVIGSGSTIASNKTYSVAIGTNNSCTEGTSVAIGYNSDSGFDAVAIGNGATATNSTAIAIGKSANSSLNTSITIGASSSCQSDTKIAIGYNVVGEVGSSIILKTPEGALRVQTDGALETSPDGGTNWNAVGGGGASNNWLIANNGADFAIAPIAEGSNAIAIGNDVRTTNQAGVGANSVTIGSGIRSHSNAITIGANHTSGVETGSGTGTIAIGYGVNALTKTYGIAIGYTSTIQANYATAIGYSALASTTGSIAIGYDATAFNSGPLSDAAVAIGWEAQITDESIGVLIKSRATGGLRVLADGTLETTPDGGTNWNAVGGGGSSALVKKLVTGTTYDLVADDKNKMLVCNNASAVTITVPDAIFTYDTDDVVEVHVMQVGAGQVSVVGGGSQTVNTADTLNIRGQFSLASLMLYEADTWVMYGDLETT
jgi:hypothetical protein